jgi:hypothetical protein
MTTLSDVHREHREAFERFVLEQAAPWHREHLTALYTAWHTYNTSYFEGQMTPPYLLLAEPVTPRVYGDTSPASGFGAKLQIRIRPSLVRGTHPHLRQGLMDHATRARCAIGRQRFVDDILLHETIHQYHMEVIGRHEDSYDGHGPSFRDCANRIGATLGLPPVRASKVPKKERDKPSCAQWPHNVRPADYYQGAVCYVWKLPPLPEEKLYAELARLTRTCDRAMLERLCTRLLASKKTDDSPQLTLEDAAPPAGLDKIESLVFQALRTMTGWQTAQPIADRIGKAAPHVGGALRNLVWKEFVVQDGPRKRYRLASQKETL